MRISGNFFLFTIILCVAILLYTKHYLKNKENAARRGQHHTNSIKVNQSPRRTSACEDEIASGIPSPSRMEERVPRNAQKNVPESDEVLGWLQKAETGDAEAMFEVAKAYRKGEGAPMDWEKAQEYALAAANLGYGKAELAAGTNLYWGMSTPRNEKAGIEYLQRAAQKGSADAKFFIGTCCETEAGGFFTKAARKWVYEAAEQGHAEAQLRLAHAFMTGDAEGAHPGERLQVDMETVVFWLCAVYLHTDPADEECRRKASDLLDILMESKLFGNQEESKAYFAQECQNIRDNHSRLMEHPAW